jgi:enamine deaminase RidA (YjgF/YER057c/UK114 family)
LKEDISFYFPSIGDSYSLGDMVYISYTIPFSSNIKVSINEDNLKDNTIGLIGHLDATSSGAYHEIVGIVSGDKWSCVTRVIDIK